MGRSNPHANPTSAIHTGAIVEGRWELVARRGSGAMGEVWSAKHVALGSAVAIKFLHPDLVTNEASRTRFAREARLAAALGERCRYISRVIDYGVIEEVGPFLVMELLQGEELSERLRRQGRLSLEATVRIVWQLCRALDAAHKGGVIHRDVKPGNIFLAQPHTNMSVFVKLMDFGVAKLVDLSHVHDGKHPTRTGAVVGTPAYMSPEQLLAQDVDHRTDLWGVAATVYRVLTAHFPFGNGTLSELGVRIVTGEAKPPGEIVAGLPPALDEWMAKGLAKSPENRFQTALELADALCEATGITIGMGVSAPSALERVTTPPPALERVATPPSALRRNPTPASDGRIPTSGMRLVAARPALDIEPIDDLRARASRPTLPMPGPEPVRLVRRRRIGARAVLSSLAAIALGLGIAVLTMNETVISRRTVLEGRPSATVVPLQHSVHAAKHAIASPSGSLLMTPASASVPPRTRPKPHAK